MQRSTVSRARIGTRRRHRAITRDVGRPLCQPEPRGVRLRKVEPRAGVEREQALPEPSRSGIAMDRAALTLANRTR